MDDVVKGILLAERFGVLGEEYILGRENISHRELNLMALSLVERKPCLSLAIPTELARATVKTADKLHGHNSGSGYEAALLMLTNE